MATNSFSYGSTDLEGASYGLTVQEFNEPWSPTPSTGALGSAGSGYRAYGSGYAAGELTLPCVVMGSSTSDLRDKRDAIMTLLDASLGPKKLTLDHIPNRYWLAIPSSAIPAPQLGEMATQFDLTFLLEGHAYNTTATTGTETLTTSPHSFTIASPSGSAAATVVWYLRNTTGATVTGNIKLDSVTWGEYIQWNGSLSANYWLRIGSEDSNGRYLYTFDVSTTGGADPTALSYTNAKTGITTSGGDWPRIKHGTNNTITVTGLSSGTCQYSYRSRYIGG